MSKPKILIFAPREQPPETIEALEGLGCELVFGDRAWQLPRTPHEDAVVEAAREAVAADGDVHASYADQPADHAGFAAAARRREIHRRGRRYRHRGRDRA